MNKAKSQPKMSEKPEAFMPDDSMSVGSTWGLISMDDVPEPTDLLKHPPAVTHQSFRKPFETHLSKIG